LGKVRVWGPLGSSALRCDARPRGDIVDPAKALEFDLFDVRDALESVRLQAPITVRDLSSEVRRDWIQLIGRNPAHTTAGKGKARRMPQEKGIPPKTRT
jgi:hypothetical protein